eukprot:CAMPEP_0168505866 /NCGR_PEP_ID=MMETSP0228-20121227/77085_1 /TAXON_ID=133427 /ORGANISM="Protoceratium reticulatum, Strain CCCM 535 (=CCMP 1889)" /LENGTH=270 /DNA_ID=CAMNT_0008522953 /DNA_START=12 /DNA_END=821 /DNA_ORIENTATION=+
MKPGSPDEGPVTWISGAELAVHIDCKTTQGEVKTEAFDPDSRSCYLSVRIVPRGWSTEYRQASFNHQGRRARQTVHGLYIRVQTSGFMRHFSFTALMGRLTAVLVLLTLPRRVVMFFCMHCLGHLSKMYTQVFVETFRFADYMAGMASRLMVCNAAFVELVDAEDAGETGISKERMRERLREVLRLRQLAGLVEFCFKAVTSSTQNETLMEEHLKGVQEVLHMASGRAEGSVSQGEELINSDSFSVACTSNEWVNFDTVVQLWDVDRRRC